MKKILISTLVLFLVASCTKEQSATADSTSTSKKDPNEVTLVQAPNKLKNSKGEEITVTYFAKGEEVAVKLERQGMEEEVLSARTISTKGDPIFANEKYMWEGAMKQGGKLSDADGNMVEYMEIETPKK